MITRRRFLIVAAGGAAVFLAPRALFGLAHRTKITVFAARSRACCAAWASHLSDSGFDVEWRDAEDMSAMKRANRIPERLWACHTAFVAGYVLEGHVTPAAIRVLLNDQPPITGLAVAGTPSEAGETQLDEHGDINDVLSFNARGETKVFWRAGVARLRHPQTDLRAVSSLT